MKKYLEYIIYGLGYCIWIIFTLVMFFEGTESIVPFWDLAENWTYLILFIFWPLITSIILGLFGKLLFSRIYLWIFKKLHKDWNLGYVKSNPHENNWKKTFSRLFNVFLVTVGLVDAFLAAQIIIPANFLTNLQLENYIVAGITPKYTPTVLSQSLCLIIPISVGLWSIVWSLEDSGLVQYKMKNIDKGEHFSEMHPLFKDFSAYISGYGGISSIIFYLGYFIYFFTEYNQLGGNFADLIFFVFLIFVFLSIYPSFMLLNLISSKFLVKNLKLSPDIRF